MRCTSVILLIFLLAGQAGLCQSSDSVITRAVAAAVRLDSVVITATRQGFDVEDFIRLVQHDQSLYRAFKNLRFASHRFTAQMEFVDRKGEVRGTYRSENVQTVDGHCRTMTIVDESASGNFYRGKKEKYRYYTAELYDRVFVTHGRQCATETDTLSDELPEDADKTDSHVSELKKLIFTPGRQAHVPLIGKKTEVFSERMLPYYDFTIRSAEFAGTPVYVFEAHVSDAFVDKEGKTVFRKLVTYFSKHDFQVVARRYHLAHRNAIFRFDVQMSVDLTRVDGQYYPTIVRYEGTWNMPGKRKETGTFEVRLRDFQT
ncbi:MAG: hypothetical protein R3330_11510 [Saprospiraceae bacterium]|nr:hypothetical protein [Saprospiraceae bacterium]